MRQLYYTIQTLLRGRGGNFVKLFSLTLGLLVGILLFSQIAYELSYESFYKEPERVALLRLQSVKVFRLRNMTMVLFVRLLPTFGRRFRIWWNVPAGLLIFGSQGCT